MKREKIDPFGLIRAARSKPSKDEVIAALLLTLMRCDDSGKLVPCVDREEAKSLTARQIIERFEIDHYPIPVTLGGTNHPTNLQALLKAEHRKKTAKRDAGELAKMRRYLKKRRGLSDDKVEAFKRELLAQMPDWHEDDLVVARAKVKPRWGSRPMGHPTLKRTMKGKVVPKGKR